MGSEIYIHTGLTTVWRMAYCDMRRQSSKKVRAGDGELASSRTSLLLLASNAFSALLFEHAAGKPWKNLSLAA